MTTPDHIATVVHDDGHDLLIRAYTDGTVTVASRPGRDDTAATWGPEYDLTERAS